MELLTQVSVLLIAISLSAAQCPLEEVVSTNSQCMDTTNDCSGLNCTPMAPFENFTASFNVVNRCEDPVQVNLTIASGSGAAFSALFDQNKVIQFSVDTSVSVGMSRNATHLDFQVTIFHTANDSVTLFPDSLIPLNPADCMCSSLQALAVRANDLHPLIESDCTTTRNCTAVRCAIHVGVVYFVEVVVLSCTNTIEFLVEDENLNIIEADAFQGPGNATRNIVIAGFPFVVEVDIIVQPYSMITQIFLEALLIGRLDITPRQTIILDRTQCDIPEFPTVPVPTILPPPQPVASNAPAVCVSLSETAQKAYAKASILRCELRAECASGLACVLNIGESKYRVDINLTRSSVAFGVLSSDGQTRYGGSKNKNTTVTLPAPQGTALLFGQLLETDKVGFKLQLRVSFLTTGQQTEELIPFTVIAFPPSNNTTNNNTTNITAIVVPVVIALLLIIALCVVALIIVFCVCRNKKTNSAPFMRMSDLQEKELENYVKGDITNPFQGAAGKSTVVVSTDGDDNDEDVKVDLASTTSATTV